MIVDGEGEFRIYRVRSGYYPEIVATTDTKEGVGTTLITLGLEGEFEGCTVGVMWRGHDAATGEWIVNPYGKGTPRTRDMARRAGSRSHR